MADIVNRYRGQYQAIKGADPNEFDALWSSACPDAKDGPVKDVLKAVFGVLQRDIENTTRDSDSNRKLFDRQEFRDLVSTTNILLENYVGIEKSDLVETTDVVRKRLVSSISKEFQKCVKDALGKGLVLDPKIVGSIEKSIEKLFSDARKVRKTQSVPGFSAPDFTDVLNRFSEKLQKSVGKQRTVGLDGLRDQILQSDQFRKQVERLGKAIRSGNFKSLVKSGRGGKGKRTEPVGTASQPAVVRRLRKRSPGIGVADRQSIRTIRRVRKTIRGKSDKENGGSVVQKAVRKETAKQKKGFKGGPSKKADKSVKILRKRLRSGFGFAVKCLGLALSPMSKFLKGAWKTIRHPLDTLGLLFKSGVLGKVLEIGLTNGRGGGFAIGAIAAIACNFVERFVFPLVNRYVVSPALWVANGVMKAIDPDEPGSIGSKLKSVMDVLGPFFKVVKQFFVPQQDGDSLPLTLFLNLARYVGVGFPRKCAEYLVNNADVILKTYVNRPMFLRGFASSVPLGNMLLTVMYAAGNAIAKIWNVDDEHRLTLSDQIEKDTSESARKISERVIDRLVGDGSVSGRKNVEAIRDRIYKLEDELYEEQELTRKLKSARGSEVETLPADFVSHFTKSQAGVYAEKNLKDVLEDMSRQTFGSDFWSLGVSEQLDGLEQLLNQRHAKTQDLYDRLKSDTDANVKSAVEEIRKPIQLMKNASYRRDDGKFVRTDYNRTVGSHPYVAKIAFPTDGTYRGGIVGYDPRNGSTASFDLKTDDGARKFIDYVNAGTISGDDALYRHLASKGIIGKYTRMATWTVMGTEIRAPEQAIGISDENVGKAKDEISRFLRDMYAKAKRETRDKVVAASFQKGIEKVQDVGWGDGTHAQTMDEEQWRKTGNLARSVNGILKAKTDDMQKSRDLASLAGEAFKDLGRVHDDMMRTLSAAFVSPGGNVIVNVGEGPVEDLER